MKKKFKLENLDCANCAAKMENAIRQIAGVKEATMSFMTQKLVLDVEDEHFDTVMAEVEKVCKKVEPDLVIHR